MICLVYLVFIIALIIVAAFPSRRHIRVVIRKKRKSQRQAEAVTSKTDDTKSVDAKAPQSKTTTEEAQKSVEPDLNTVKFTATTDAKDTVEAPSKKISTDGDLATVKNTAPSELKDHPSSKQDLQPTGGPSKEGLSKKKDPSKKASSKKASSKKGSSKKASSKKASKKAASKKNKAGKPHGGRSRGSANQTRKVTLDSEASI